MKAFRLGALLVSLAVLASMASADTITTTVYFNVPSDIGFTVTLPGQTASGSPTADVEYNSTTPTLSKINCTVRESPYDSQTDTVPCFNYTNTGNRAINITLQFASALPSGVTVKAGLNDSGWVSSCGCTLLPGCDANDCVNVTDTGNVTVANIAYGGYDEVWMWADFSNYAGGSSEFRTLNHVSTAE